MRALSSCSFQRFAFSQPDAKRTMQLVMLSLTDGSGHLDRTELRKLVEMMCKQALLALFGARCTLGRGTVN